MTGKVRPTRLGAVLRAHDKEQRKAVHRGIKRAAYRGRTILVQRATEEGKVYRGQYKNSWQVRRIGPLQGWTLTNIAPHAGIVEKGARPHRVSREGVEAIYEWVRRKIFGISQSLAEQNEEVESIAWAIVRKIRRHGQKGTFLVQRSLPWLRKALAQEIARAIREAGKKR